MGSVDVCFVRKINLNICCIGLWTRTTIISVARARLRA